MQSNRDGQDSAMFLDAEPFLQPPDLLGEAAEPHRQAHDVDREDDPDDGVRRGEKAESSRHLGRSEGTSGGLRGGRRLKKSGE